MTTSSREPCIVVGLGQIGGVLSHGLLRIGHPVYPVGRESSVASVLGSLPDGRLPRSLWITVGESELDETLANLPPQVRDRVGLVQNELLPAAWLARDVADPTVAVIWFEKKRGIDVRVLRSTPVRGPGAADLVRALGALDVPAHVLDSDELLLQALVAKNVYILTTNVAGLRVGGTVRELWSNHEALARRLAAEAIAIQESLTGEALPPGVLIRDMLEAFEADPEHKCMGRSAPARLARAVQHADDAGLDVPTLKSIAAEARSES